MKRFRVDILGEGFEVRSDASEQKVREIAQYVDGKMREAVSEGRSTSREKAAVLAAMNIAEEFFKEQEEIKRSRKEMEERSERLLELIKREVDQPLKNDTKECK